jgi:predicted NAD/FAD-dependent oxidoreductase
VTCFKAEKVRLAACGDFCLGAGVENAVLSGTAAADAVRQFFEA